MVFCAEIELKIGGSEEPKGDSGRKGERMIAFLHGELYGTTENSAIVECAGELGCSNLVIVTNADKRTIKKNGYRIEVVPVSEF